MFKIKGKNYKTIPDLVRERIRKGIFPKLYRKACGQKNIDSYTEKYLEQASKENIFVQAKNYEQEELLNNELYGNHIPFDDFYNPRDDKTAYRISTNVYDYLLQKGIDLKVIEVKNIGDLSLEERNEIKRYHKSQLSKKRKKVLDKLRAEYGPLQ